VFDFEQLMFESGHLLYQKDLCNSSKDL